jgi:hypothetical protein
VDEPLYAHYLRVTGREHPGRDEVIAAQDGDGRKVVRDVVLGPCDKPVLFMKHMAHHLVEIERDFLSNTSNVLLTRDPLEMLPSLIQQLPEPQLRDTSLAMQTELLRELQALGQEPPVLDARELLSDPEGVLRQLCERLGIGFERAMLRWPPGPKPADGVWARHWYQSAHRSTGFLPYQPKSEPFPERLRSLLDECRPHYETLYARAIHGVRRR